MPYNGDLQFFLTTLPSFQPHNDKALVFTGIESIELLEHFCFHNYA